ncbi:16S rRNA (guanine(527)-N(7))-methyltransferase RsmG [Amylibacter sp. IMCC11727]|uniref:16S rRNA (guanine(527)-N(7))-methyltransferase RsmG n=1 Tax=Amylibacter sp. IMCC11727 TaxID=3039851 RepID=UPI00244E3CE2|nr:16S rRNA (guanine(527)-N(7))-methyltransferase RsmG [Amylibacter sp. IMCC11727]WGI22057.1 16S rRNA (guanine(527)-N(7))-methyltransferase RsmG [Amylibacter sp. IMCC11727]
MNDFTDLRSAAAYFNVSRETSEKLEIYENLLVKWNKSINLVSKSTLNSAATRHFADSMQLWALRKDFDVWVDIGSGAGFPGMVLAIMAEGQGAFHLVESDARKCAFLRNVSRETNTPVTVHTTRIEEFEGAKADIVSARALASVDALFSYTEKFLQPDAISLYLKGQTCETELEEASRSWTYEAEQFASKTDENGTVLRIKDIARVG